MTPIPASIHAFLQEPYSLTQEQVAFYQENSFIKLRQVLNDETLQYFGKVITEKVNELNRETKSMQDRSTYGKAFIQLGNLWTTDERIRELVFSKRVAKIATDLMKTEGVRLYHDQALYKEPGGGFTPWHADQYYWPLETDKTVTAWMPLQATPLEMGPLQFSAASHKLLEGRELQISDESETMIQERLRVTDFKHVVEAFDAGEISFHSGWVFHRAGPNLTNDMRKVMTIIYMDKNMKLKQPENQNQVDDWNAWCPGTQVGEVINSPLSPVLY